MNTLSIDIETYSSENLKKTGVYRYTQAPDFTVLFFSYTYNTNPVVCLTGDDFDDPELREEFIEMLTSPTILKTAHNANFERVCLSVFFDVYLDPVQWECTMVKAAMLGWPMQLEAVASAMELPVHKDPAGKALIRYFSEPCKPTKTNGQRTRNLPQHDGEKWEAYRAYNVNDVVVERAISGRIDHFHIPGKERRLYALDQRINDRGILLDADLARNALQIYGEYVRMLFAEAVALTGLTNPNSRAQLLKWLNSEMPLEDIQKLRKTDIPDIIRKAVGYENEKGITRLLVIRQEMAKTSVTKYKSMLFGVCADGRVRGLLQFCGGSRTWRWAGRLVQVQNLPKNELKDIDVAREIVKSGDGDFLQMCFGNVPDTLSQLIRSAFVASPGTKFGISDFSAIEARVLAWLSGERWRLDVFNKGGKIYEASASQMFKIPIEQITKGSDYRQKGKMSELALGYQGGKNAIIKIEISNKTPLYKRIPEAELPGVVSAWRAANPAIVKTWRTVENAAISCMRGTPVTIQHGIRFTYDRKNNCLTVRLPSGRNLTYADPKLKPGKFDKPALTYMGMDQTTKQWRRQDTYGGKLVENIVQAIARDLLAEALLRIDDAGFEIVIHVHDEVVVDKCQPGDIDRINELMVILPDWAKGLPMAADGYELEFYRKEIDD